MTTRFDTSQAIDGYIERWTDAQNNTFAKRQIFDFKTSK